MISTLLEFSRLKKLELSIVSIDHDDLVIFQQLIAPGSELEYLTISDIRSQISSLLISTLFQPSSLQELILTGVVTIDETQLLLPHGNTNLKELTISHSLLCPLAALIVNITSLTYLQIEFPINSDLPVLTNIVQSHHTLKILRIDEILYCTDSTNLLQLIEAADSNEHVVTFKLDIFDYDNLPPHIREQYKHLLLSDTPDYISAD